MGERRKTADGRILERQADGTIIDVTPVDSQIEATPLPRNPYEVQREQRDFSVDRGDRSFDEAKKLRDEFNSRSSVVEYNVALGTFNSAMNTDNTAEGDQALITSFARMMDPNSVVREGEFATAAGNETMFNQLRAKFAKEFGAEGGGRLTDEGRERLRAEMRNQVVNRFGKPYERDRYYYQQLAGEYNIDPMRVIGPEASSAYPEGLLDPPQVKENLSVATGNTGVENELPQKYQDAHYAYLSKNWGDIDPEDYVRFRTALDERYDQNPNPDAYRDAVPTFNNAAKEGQRPADLGAVPSATSELGWLDQQLNNAAQTNTGAYLANAGNAWTGGLMVELGGDRDRLEDIRDISPEASLLGEVSGGIGGVYTGGRILQGLGSGLKYERARRILQNPTTANAAYGTTYGATQDRENRLRGAGVGLVSSIVGDKIGGAVAKQFPITFNRAGFRAADDSVPSVEDLQAQANRQYADVEARGVAADTSATDDLLARSNNILEQNGYLGPQGELVGDGPLVQAAKLLRQYQGQPMTPTQAGATRKAIGRGRSAMDGTKPDYEQRRATGLMLDEFDDWADPVLPGVDQARQTSQRAILGREMENANEMARGPQSAQFTQSGEENAFRSIYRGMDKNQVRGRNAYPPELTEKIQEVSRGTPFSNAMRTLGKFAPNSAVSAMPTLGASAIGGSTLGPFGLAAGGLVAGGGLFGRKVATNKTTRAALEAELLARGGPVYKQMVDEAIEEARRRGAIGGAGIMAPAASIPTRGGN